MVRLRSNRRTSAEAESNKDGNQVKGNGEDYLESLPVIKNVKATKTASTNVTPSNIAGKNNDNPSQPLFMKDAKILDAASLHSGMDDIGSKRRRGNGVTAHFTYSLDRISILLFMLHL